MEEARDLWREDRVRKKFVPRSFWVTGWSSIMVKEPIPGRIRFLRISVAVEEEPMTRTEERSRDCWPWDPQIRSWRSYFWVVSGVED